MLTFWPLKNDIYSDSSKYFLSYDVNVIPKNLHAQKKTEKVSEAFLRLALPSPPPPLKLTPPTTPTPTTDESAFE